MAYDFTQFKKKAQDITEHLSKELSALHTGRASVALLDVVSVESYGSYMAIPHMATVTTEDARTIRIVPWDKVNAKAIEKAINEADLGVSVAVDDQGLRISFPQLTTERRVALTKVVGDRVEDARVALKNERERVKNEITTQERDGEISEDEKTRALEELQKLVDGTNGALEVAREKKEKEILGE